jgi:uncharacterized peroxidase-related enzyme
MTTAPTSRFPFATLESVPADIRERILDEQRKAGFVPNVFLALARRPDEFRAFFGYYSAVMARESNLTKGDKEMIIVATSAANQCLYCVVAHGALLRIYEKKPLVADQVAVNYRKADIPPRQKAMLGFALKVCTDSASITDADFAALRKHGFNDEDAWDIGEPELDAAERRVLPDGASAEGQDAPAGLKLEAEPACAWRSATTACATAAASSATR